MSFGLVERGMLGHISPYYRPKQVAICKVDCILFLSISNVMGVMSGWQFRLKILPRRIRVSCVHVFLGLLAIWAALKAMWFYTLPTFQAFCIHKATRENCLHYLALWSTPLQGVLTAKVCVFPRIFKTLSKRPDDEESVDFCWDCLKIPLFSQLPKEKMWTIFLKCHPGEPTLKLFLTYKMSWQDYHIISIAAVENIKGSCFKIKQKNTLSCLKSSILFLFFLFLSHLQTTMHFGTVGLSSHNKQARVKPASPNGSNHFCYCSKWDFFFFSWLIETDLGPLHLLPASVPTPKIAYWRKKCQLLSSAGCFSKPIVRRHLLQMKPGISPRQWAKCHSNRLGNG